MSDFQIIPPGSASERIWQDKYRFGDEPTVSNTFGRVARALASVEPDNRDQWFTRFHEIMARFEFLPAGRILAGAGTDRDVTLMNCFVMGTIEDSLDGIMRSVREAALTLKTGGGVGMDFSSLRPRGASVRGVDSISSGAVSFMDIWDAMCRTIMSAGARRGAMMATLRCDHPDIEEFIAAKREPGRLTGFNLSVLVTDAFMKTRHENAEWPLMFGGKVYRTVSARDLWNRITELTYEYAEPGVIFIDTINTTNPLQCAETIYATNPCAEQPLPPYGSCLLGSINLTQFVLHPFTPSATLDLKRMQYVVAISTRALDNVIDITKFPLPEQRDEAQLKRRIGLGITGLGDALIMLGHRYGSQAAVETTGNVTSTIEAVAMSTSQDLGEEKGCFPLFPESGILQPRRNSHLTSIAPTGTISLLAGNVTGGIEPAFDLEYDRKVLEPDGSHRIERMETYALRLARHLGAPTTGPAWVTATELSVSDHLRMMAAAQRHVDSAISKTVNCPESMTLDQFRAVYDKAYALGLKGCATHRPNPVGDAVRGSVLVRDTMSSNVVRLQEPMTRPGVLHGSTYKIKPAGSDHALYLTINDYDDGGRRRPFELFLASKEVDAHEWRVALSRMISAIFRKGGDVRFVAEELRQVFSPRGGWFANGCYVASVPAAIGEMLARHMGTDDAPLAAPTAIAIKHCPKCQIGGLVFSEGCEHCNSCDYTKC